MIKPAIIKIKHSTFARPPFSAFLINEKSTYGNIRREKSDNVADIEYIVFVDISISALPSGIVRFL